MYSWAFLKDGITRIMLNLRDGMDLETVRSNPSPAYLTHSTARLC